MLEVITTLFLGLLMLIGLIGCIVPLLPDLALIWGAALGYGILNEWSGSGEWYFGLISIMGLAGIGAEIWVSGIGARKGGASFWAIFLGVVFAVGGFFSAGPIGALIGLMGGIFFVEYLRRRDIELAARATFGAGLGCGASLGVKLSLGIAMVVVWLIWVFA